jgi:hypothetical protein
MSTRLSVSLTSAAAHGSRANRVLLPVLGVFAGGLVLSVIYARAGLGVLCPFRMLTGWRCPLCGSTRMGAALLQGQFADAFAWNPLVFCTLAVLAGLAGVWVVEALGGPRLRIRRLRKFVGPLSGGRWLATALGLAVLYTLARNLG